MSFSDEFDEYTNFSKGSSSDPNHSKSNSVSDISNKNPLHVSKKRRYDSPRRSLKRSFIWKYFNKTADPSSPNKIMIYSLNLSDGRLCKKTYATLDSTSNVIIHLASKYGIVEQGKIHIKINL